MKCFRVFSITVSAVALILVGLSVPAQASSGTKISSSDRQHVLEFFREYSVPPSRWGPLIKEWERGKPWDSVKGGQPASIEMQDRADATVSISRYPDGSVKVSSLEKPIQAVGGGGGDGTTPYASVSGCRVFTGSGYAVYRGCRVENQWGNIYLGFNADYEVWPGYGQIDGVGNQTAGCWGWGWSCDQPWFEPIKSGSDGWGPGTARAHSWIHSPWGSWDVWVQLNVSGSGAWATSS